MRKITLIISVSLVTICLLGSASAFAKSNSCWGEASAAFGKLGVMGEHASTQSNPRLGLANVAVVFYEAGIIPEPTMDELGIYLAAEAGVTLDKCLSNARAVAEAESFAQNNAACWGQASKVFAQTGMMGQHSSSFDNPRLGIRNLARYLFDLGLIPEDSMAALGAYVADELGYDISACE